ncbi:MAG: DMT family transporter [Pseudomonadota bacterium]
MLLWGGNAVVTKASASVLSAAEISFFRWAVATLLLAPLAWPALQRERAAVLARLPRTVILGLLGCALFPYMMYLAASYTSAIHLGLIQTLMPVLAVCFARVLFGAAISRAALIGAAVSMIGVAVVVSHGDPLLLFAQPANRGDLIMIAATACFALYSVLLGRWRSEAVSPLVDLLGQSFVAMVAMLPLWWASASSAVQPQGLWMIAYAGALGSVVAPLLWIQGISRIGPARAAPFFNVLPLVTAALAIAFLGEALTVSLVIGGLLTISGVVLAQRRH